MPTAKVSGLPLQNRKATVKRDVFPILSRLTGISARNLSAQFCLERLAASDLGDVLTFIERHCPLLDPNIHIEGCRKTAPIHAYTEDVATKEALAQLEDWAEKAHPLKRSIIKPKPVVATKVTKKIVEDVEKKWPVKFVYNDTPVQLTPDNATLAKIQSAPILEDRIERLAVIVGKAVEEMRSVSARAHNEVKELREELGCDTKHDHVG